MNSVHATWPSSTLWPRPAWRIAGPPLPEPLPGVLRRSSRGSALRLSLRRTAPGERRVCPADDRAQRQEGRGAPLAIVQANCPDEIPRTNCCDVGLPAHRPEVLVGVQTAGESLLCQQLGWHGAILA